MKRVVILGAGFGGLELATRLAEQVPDEAQVTLIDQNDGFVLGFAKVEVLFGRRTVAEVKSLYRNLAMPGVAFKQEHVDAIDPAARRVVTRGGTYEADVLVVALGAEVDASATPGLFEGGHDFYTVGGVARAAGPLAKLERGQVLISILGLPYKCPPAPFEVALQLHDVLEKRGVRKQVVIRVVSPAPVPLPVSPKGSEVLLGLMKERGIFFNPGTQVTSLEPSKKAAVLADGSRFPYELFLGVPVHRAPKVVLESGLAPKGWVEVDPATLETRFPNVYAIGDVTQIPAGQGAVPKAGAFADRGAAAVADDIVNRLRGKAERGRFDGAGACYLEFGVGNVAKIDANYFGGPKPVVDFLGPSPEFLPHKTEFAEVRLKRWFKG